MAVFKQVNQVYKTEEDLKRLIEYVCGKGYYRRGYGLMTTSVDLIESQFIYNQNCYGAELRTRALHYILSFDSNGWEHWMDIDKVIKSTFLSELFIRFKNNPYLAVVHKKDENNHIHFIVDPVSIESLKLYHCSREEYYNMLQEIAKELYFSYRVALAGVSYIDENSRLRWENRAGGAGFLYMDRVFPYDMSPNRK